MIRVRYLAQLIGDLTAYSVATRTFWIVPFVAAILVVAAVASATALVVPYTVYTLL